MTNSVPENTKGCLITQDGGRFDVFIEKFLTEDISFIENFVLNMLAYNNKIFITEIDGEPECRTW